MNTNNVNRESAKTYLSWGWSVLPVMAKSKAHQPPYGPYEFAKRHAIEEEIDAWFDLDPDANIAVMCGPISHLLILDVDDENEHPELAAMLAGCDVPPVQVKTARGYHYYFTYPEGEELSQANKPFGWMDVRGVNDYALLPPSTHPLGKEYEWIVAPVVVTRNGQQFVDLPAVPPALLELLKSSVNQFPDGSWISDGFVDEDDYDEDDDDDWDEDDFYEEEKSKAEGEALAVSLLSEQGSGQTVAAYLHACMVAADAELCYESCDIDDWKLLGLVRKALAISKVWQANPAASVDELKAATLDVPATEDAPAEKRARF